MPRLIALAGEAFILLPWDPMYDQDAQVCATGLRKQVLPLGTAFSRLWYNKGTWLPVAN
jgi:hypothetical protein